jgi:hypothetical protein
MPRNDIEQVVAADNQSRWVWNEQDVDAPNRHCISLQKLAATWLALILSANTIRVLDVLFFFFFSTSSRPVRPNELESLKEADRRGVFMRATSLPACSKVSALACREVGCAPFFFFFPFVLLPLPIPCSRTHLLQEHLCGGADSTYSGRRRVLCDDRLAVGRQPAQQLQVSVVPHPARNKKKRGNIVERL